MNTVTPQQEDVLEMLRNFDTELDSLWDSTLFVGAVIGALALGYALGRLRR